MGRRRNVADAMDADDFKALKELLSDAEACGRLSQWEENFLDDMRERVLTYGDRVFLSERQREALTCIEQKVYAT